MATKAKKSGAKNSKKASSKRKSLSAKERDELIAILKTRFEKHPERHKGLEWAAIRKKLEATEEALSVLYEMEQTGGEPDVVALGGKKAEIAFVDCSEESPKGRRSICYDAEALASRKEHKPKDSAMNMAATIGIELLSEEEYRKLQELGEFDRKTSSWIATPADIRERGGALFCDRRYGHVFVYHNGAESYYAARGFRGALRLS